MKQTLLEMEWQNRKIESLRKLCLQYPLLNMNELADCSHLKVEDVYKMIKEYDLPYNWKFQKE
ncbi:hypothetical protein [Enterococcus sp. DIV1420a]|uniref:hypothetical protein n=1 Tax=Enterococcus TaxID=1350 RepID=UPI003F2606BF